MVGETEGSYASETKHRSFRRPSGKFGSPFDNQENRYWPGRQGQSYEPAPDRLPPSTSGDGRDADEERRQKQFEQQQAHRVLSEGRLEIGGEGVRIFQAD